MCGCKQDGVATCTMIIWWKMVGRKRTVDTLLPSVIGYVGVHTRAFYIVHLTVEHFPLFVFHGVFIVFYPLVLSFVLLQ